MSWKYYNAKRLRRSQHGKKMVEAKWRKREQEIAENPPPISDANRIADHLRARRGKIWRVVDVADPKQKTVTTYVLRYSVNGRTNQYDLHKNGEHILTAGQKRCFAAMAPEYHHIFRP